MKIENYFPFSTFHFIRILLTQNQNKMRKETHAKKNTRWMKAVLLSFFALLLCSVSGYAQNITVTGKVSDAMGTLPGVSVAIKGTTNGTVTDVDGKYSLNVAKNATLVFSFVGMKSQEVTVNGRKVIDDTMTNDTELLDEVVVVGYGTSKKSSLTSAVSAVKGDELLKAPATNVSQLLGGRLPGISSLQESGEPGLDQASLKIRGSVYSVSYIVDGFPVSNINDLDPNDIESVSVLKDGASAAVYGLAGAGGVIIVTTKRGEAGKTKVTYDASYGVSMNANFPKFMNGPQYAHYYNMAQMMDQLASGAIKDRSEYTPYYTQENIAAMTNGDPTDGWDNVDYIDKVFGTGTNQKHSVTVQGGNEKMRYFTSLGYLGQNGNIDNFTYRRYNLRANIESEFPGYDEYQYDVDTIGHDPNELISYLTAKFNAFTPAQVQAELEALFNQQYTLTTREEVQIRYRTVTWTDEEGNEHESEEAYEYYILHVTLRNHSLGTVAVENLTEDEKGRYAAILELKGNKPYLFGDNIYANPSEGEHYEIPGEALSDPSFAALITEAEKYLGYPYVWGGSNPSTSFDCSGFVCWVFTNSGVHNLPRTTAQGISPRSRN